MHGVRRCGGAGEGAARVTSMVERAAERDCRSSGATDRAGVSEVTVDARQSRYLISYFPYPTGATEETDADTVIKKTSGR
jgi:hypothetical protein